MRRILFLLLVALFAIAGVWANGQKESASSAKAIAKGSVSIGFSPKFLKDDFQVALLKTLKKDIAKRDGWTLALAPDANQDVAKQVADIENMIAAGVTDIIIVPVDAAGVVPAIKKANAANIPVFSVDDAPVGGKVAATVRADNVNAGVQNGEEMVKLLKSRPCWPNCTVLELQGGLDTPNGRDRDTGFYDTMKKLAPSVKVIQRPTSWDADKAANATQDVLTQYPNLDGISMASELMCAAVNAQLKAAGRDAPAGDPKSVVRVAIDGTPAGLNLIRHRALDATVSQPLNAYASRVLEAVALANEGKTLKVGKRSDGQVVMTPVGPQYQLRATLVTLKNVDDPTLWGNLK
jgi:ABC-type sugar transport system substrate-binding protein